MLFAPIVSTSFYGVVAVVDGFLNWLCESYWYWFGRMLGFKWAMIVVNICKDTVPVLYIYIWFGEIVHVRDRGIRQVKEKGVIVRVSEQR